MIWDSLRTEMRARYPAFRRSVRTAKPTNPVAPVIWEVIRDFSKQIEEKGKTYEDQLSCHFVIVVR